MKNYILKKLYSLLGEVNKKQLRILIFHDIERKQETRFEELIYYLKKSWNIISPNEFKEMTKFNSKKDYDRNILISFDDGYKSQRIVAEKYLNPLKIKALFFVVSDFIKINSFNESQEFIKKNFYKDKNHKRDISPETSNMILNDIKYLIECGHSIGGHSKTHADLSKIKDNDTFIDEIINSSTELENMIGNYKIDDFAYTFGDINSINERSVKLITNRYKYLYSGLRGNNFNLNSKIIRRDAINLNEPFQVISSYLNGYVDIIYRNKIRKLEKWK